MVSRMRCIRHLNLNNLGEASTWPIQFEAKLECDDVEDVKKKLTFLSTCEVEAIMKLKVVLCTKIGYTYFDI
ncbi:Hypothetical predicted protein [Octopus vulgaris]|uniref:Uncharacterized protein n=1 Tax=Octopus vulgaris TaxID=6645 RepID=A0AA36B713_OCTVU|nr:Hypothetical predicted protein [Octopus vulgaris]